MTTPIALPTTGGVKVDKPRMVDWGGALKPALGGPVQTILRLGTRHALDITLPVMRAEPDGRIWASRLRQAKLYGALLPFRQDGFAVGIPGAPVVNGAGQAGTTLVLRGFRGGYAVREGQAFSLITGGRRYLHFAAALAIADSSGALSLPLFPMLRVSPADGDTCEFAVPMLQGSITGNELAWTRLLSPMVDFGTITIEEDE